MRPVVVEASVAALVPRGARPLAVVPRPRRRGRWRDLAAADVVAALDAAGAGAVVLARPGAEDPGAACLAAVARAMGVPVVRLPGGAAAAWVVAVAVHAEFGDEALVRRLEALAGAPAGAAGLPRRTVGAGSSVPALRPGVLARWAGCAWRPCGRCGGGGAPGGPCGRCGAVPLGSAT